MTKEERIVHVHVLGTASYQPEIALGLAP